MLTRLLLIVALALMLAGSVGGTPAEAAGGQVADCSFGTLQTDLQSGGDWYYTPGQCSSPIIFTSTITISNNASLTTEGGDITLDGNNSVQLFSVDGGVSLSLNDLTLSHGRTSCSSYDCVVFGGAIYNNGTVAITNSTLSGNTAECSDEYC